MAQPGIQSPGNGRKNYRRATLVQQIWNLVRNGLAGGSTIHIETVGNNKGPIFLHVDLTNIY
jgi:hypothetical protein